MPELIEYATLLLQSFFIFVCTVGYLTIFDRISKKYY